MITTKKIADYLSFPSFFPARSSIIAPVSVCVVCSVFEKNLRFYEVNALTFRASIMGSGGRRFSLSADEGGA